MERVDHAGEIAGFVVDDRDHTAVEASMKSKPQATVVNMLSGTKRLCTLDDFLVTTAKTSEATLTSDPKRV